MKRISFFFILTVLIVSFGLANAGQVYLESSTGTWDDNGTEKIIPGGAVTFSIHLFNDNAVAAGGFAHGFRVYLQGNPAGTYTALSGDTTSQGWTTMFDLAFAINSFGTDGSGSDTIGYIGSKGMSGSGFPIGYDETSFILSTGNVAAGETMCLDSSYFPPTGSWLWAPGGAPSWDGPHCFLSEDPPCLPPSVTNAPSSLTGSHCDVMSFDFDAALNPNDDQSNTITFSADIGNIDPSSGVWSYAPTLADVGVSMAVTVSVSNGQCSSDAVVNLTFTNQAPTVTSCGDIPVSTNASTDIPMTATDDCDAGSITWSVGAFDVDNASIDPNTGVLTILTASAGNYTVEVIADDGNAAGSCTINVLAVAGSLYQVRLGCVGGQEEGSFVFLGQHVTVPVNLDAAASDLGGYDIVIAYDASALSFQSASIGDAYGPKPDGLGWEYFTYRYGPDGNCDNACPSGLLRVTAIAEINDGPNHPAAGVSLSALFNLDFLVTNDHTFECQEIPLRFYWLDCGDNGLSTSDGDLLIAQAVFDGYDPNSPNGKANIIDWNSGYPTYQGPDASDCFSNPNKYPDSTVSFENGCVWIACDGMIDDRGDLNLNNVAYEIADAVLYSNYFIYGLGVFDTNLEGQIAASDINADGLTLSVADLVYLIRVVIGDALPYPKLSPMATTVSLDDGEIKVASEMGAAYVVVEGNVTPTLLVDNMEIKYAFDAESNATRVLVYSMEAGNTFSGNFLNVHGNVSSIEFATYDGAPVTAKVIPGKFNLAQNYPNPFNPATSISFSVPVQSNYDLVIYNVTGQKVASFAGASEAGMVTIEWDASVQASGIYFYKLTAGNFTDTKKMVLLK